MQLFNLDRDLADQLMEAMAAWIEERRANPAGIESEAIEEFSGWLEERTELAEQTARLNRSAERSWGD